MATDSGWLLQNNTGDQKNNDKCPRIIAGVFCVPRLVAPQAGLHKPLINNPGYCAACLFSITKKQMILATRGRFFTQVRIGFSGSLSAPCGTL